MVDPVQGFETDLRARQRVKGRRIRRRTRTPDLFVGLFVLLEVYQTIMRWESHRRNAESLKELIVHSPFGGMIDCPTTEKSSCT